ncbi:MAG: hypothetical protein IJP03_02085 [Christensenellaceae bacterium]|nr:hypothetical protein [Christensenellaceae bacterium]
MKNAKTILAVILAVVLALTGLVACGQAPAAEGAEQVQLANGGILNLKVNPEIAIAYDNDGNVTSVSAKNADAKKILEGYTGYEGKATRTVVAELVERIGQAGYFVDEVEGEGPRTITIEIEAGSKLPSETFVDEVYADVRKTVETGSWKAPVDVKGESAYGVTDYDDTDYGPDNDGVTDYKDTDYGPDNDGVTDYKDTDYGPDNDGVTDYNDTDYGPDNDGVTDYDDTDYGPNADGVTD